jgi:ankyrin repeat protein
MKLRQIIFLGLFFSLICLAGLIDAAKRGDIGEVNAIIGAIRANESQYSLEDQENGRTALEYAVLNGHMAIVQNLIQAGADFNRWQFYESKMPIQMAVEHGHLAIISLLIESGVDVNATFRGGYGLLHLAALFGKTEAFALLISLGASVHAKDSFGRDVISPAWGKHSQQVINELNALVKSYGQS